MPDAVDEVVENWRQARPDLDFQPLAAVARVMRLSRVLDRRLKEFLAGHDIEPGEFEILNMLRRSGTPDGMLTSAFHKGALVTAGAITNRLDRMADKGLIERLPDPGDRRAIRIVLTSRGTEVIDSLLPDHLARYAQALQPLDSTETAAFVDSLRKLLDHLEE